MDARLRKKVCFWYNGTSGEIRMGLPEEYPAIRGFEKIVCSTAHEAEIWSERMRRWELLKMRMEDEQREMIEGPMRAELRSHIHHLMANARNNMNREFLRRHLELYDRRIDKTQFKRTSYLHSEAFEHGR